MNGQAGSSETRVFRARRLVARHEERIKAHPGQIFPLLCPIEEYKWIDGWECELVYSESGVVENNCVFREDLSAPFLFGSAGSTTWITTLQDHDSWRRHFVMISDAAVRKGEVSIEDGGGGTSLVRWALVVTSLNQDGSKAFDDGLEERARVDLAFLGAALRHYCESGGVLPRSEFLHSLER